MVFESLGALGEVDLVLTSQAYGIDEGSRLLLTRHHNLKLAFGVPNWRDDVAGRFLNRFIPRLATIYFEKVSHVKNIYNAWIPYWKEIEVLHRERAYDLVVGYFLAPTFRCGAALLEIPIIIDLDDLELEKMRRDLDFGPGSVWSKRLLRRRILQLEGLFPDLTSRLDNFWITNPEHKTIPSLGDAIWLPNVPFNIPKDPDLIPYGNDILFLGALDGPGNYLGLNWFLSDVWPIIRTSIPTATFRIAGGRIRAMDRQRWEGLPGVTLQGFVQDVESAYLGSCFTIAPIWIGSGTNIKVIESLLYNRTVVLTPFAQKGFGHVLKDEESFLVASTPEKFAASCIALLKDRARALMLARTGSDIVRQNFSKERFSSIVQTTAVRTLEQCRFGRRFVR